MVVEDPLTNWLNAETEGNVPIELILLCFWALTLHLGIITNISLPVDCTEFLQGEKQERTEREFGTYSGSKIGGEGMSKCDDNSMEMIAVMMTKIVRDERELFLLWFVWRSKVKPVLCIIDEWLGLSVEGSFK